MPDYAIRHGLRINIMPFYPWPILVYYLCCSIYVRMKIPLFRYLWTHETFDMQYSAGFWIFNCSFLYRKWHSNLLPDFVFCQCILYENLHKNFSFVNNQNYICYGPIAEVTSSLIHDHRYLNFLTSNHICRYKRPYWYLKPFRGGKQEL